MPHSIQEKGLVMTVCVGSCAAGATHNGKIAGEFILYDEDGTTVLGEGEPDELTAILDEHLKGVKHGKDS